MNNSDPDLIRELAERRGVILVASVGNKNSLVSTTFPASHRAVPGVAATDREDRKARFSNYGTAVKVAAPGDALISTYPAGLYAGIGGTSFAAGVVSAEAALVRSKSTAPAADSVRRMLDTAESIAYLNLGMYLGGVGEDMATDPAVTLSDQHLVEACLAGDSQGWEMLLQRYKRLIYSVPVRFGFDHDDRHRL